MNGGGFVDATIALVETKSKGSLALMGPNGGITKPSGWQPQGTETDGRGIPINRPGYLPSTAHAAPWPASDTTTAAPHEANRKKKEEGMI